MFKPKVVNVWGLRGRQAAIPDDGWKRAVRDRKQADARIVVSSP
jgi:hypothetical protein